MKALLSIREAAGVLSLLFLGLLAVSGWALMAGYVPSEDEAFASVVYWRQGGGLGAALRGLHYWLASALVVAAFVHLLATYLAGRHNAERRSWWLGLVLYFLVLGLCFTGFLLPMDQNAFWGTVVRLGIVETSPVVGPAVADLLRGGGAVNASTLPRFYALHVSILPFAALALLGLLLRPLAERLRETGRPAVRWLAVALAGLALSYLAAALLPAPLELPADATDSDYVPRPEWYFLWLFQLGKYVESVPWVRSFLLPLAGVGLLFALPLLRQKTAGRAAVAAGWCAAWIGLTALALWEDRELPPKLRYEEAMRAQAGEQFQEECYDCHGDDGRGRGPRSRAFDLETPDLTREETWLEHPRSEMRSAIRDGKGEDMPAFGRKLTPAQIDALLDYLETSFRPSTADSP
jgi:ubiquinol-cytochrome c reductase cytochrome b subunit